MKKNKAFLILNTIIWLPFGIICIFKPAILTDLTGIAMTSPAALTEIRAMYGGISSGVGILCLVAVFKASMVRPALATLSFSMAGVAISRCIGFLIDSSGSQYIYSAMVFEITTAILSWILFLRQPLDSE